MVNAKFTRPVNAMPMSSYRIYSPLSQAHLCRALYDDLRKNKTEAKMMECDHIVNEVRGCLRDIRHWMKPRPKRKQLANALDGVMVSHT